MAFTKLTIFILEILLFVVNENITKSGSVYYAGNMLIRHLCEHDTNILFTSFKMAELYRFIQM